MHGIGLFILVIYVAWVVCKGIEEEGAKTRRMLDNRHRQNRERF